MKTLTQKFKNLSRGKKIVVITCSVLVLLLVVSVPTAVVLSTDKKELETSSKKTIKSKSKTKNNKEKKDKEEVDKKDDDKKEESTSKDDDSKKSDDKKETTQETSKQSTNSNGSSKSSGNSGGNVQNTQPSQQQPQQSAPQPAPAPKPQTAWEKLGISEYAYYNTTLEGVQPDFRGSDLSVCNAEVKRIMSTYVTQGYGIGGNSYTVTGKYTGQYLGCGMKIRINGVEYSYSQAKGILGF